MGSGHDIILRELKLANDLLGNCGLARELMSKHSKDDSLVSFLDEYRKYLEEALQMFRGVLKENRP